MMAVALLSTWFQYDNSDVLEVCCLVIFESYLILVAVLDNVANLNRIVFCKWSSRGQSSGMSTDDQAVRIWIHDDESVLWIQAAVYLILYGLCCTS